MALNECADRTNDEALLNVVVVNGSLLKIIGKKHFVLALLWIFSLPDPETGSNNCHYAADDLQLLPSPAVLRIDTQVCCEGKQQIQNTRHLRCCAWDASVGCSHASDSCGQLCVCVCVMWNAVLLEAHAEKIQWGVFLLIYPLKGTCEPWTCRHTELLQHAVLKINTEYEIWTWHWHRWRCWHGRGNIPSCMYEAFIKAFTTYLCLKCSQTQLTAIIHEIELIGHKDICRNAINQQPLASNPLVAVRWHALGHI